jgi:hypothetical protein
VWHEELGTKTVPVRVKEGGTAIADVELTASKPEEGSR